MQVIGHQDVAQQLPAVPLHRGLDSIGKPLAVAVIARARLLKRIETLAKAQQRMLSDLRELVTASDKAAE